MKKSAGRPRELTFKVVLAAACCCAVLIRSTAAQAEDYSAGSVKAAFLYRFAGYVEWPSEAQDTPKFTIATLGSNDTVAALQRLLPNHSIQNHPAEVHPIKSVAQVGSAQMLYIATRDPGEVRAATAALNGRAILVVTDEESGLADGAVVNFLLLDRRVRFEISVLAAERNGLKISSELLAVAARVQGRLGSGIACASEDPLRPPGAFAGAECFGERRSVWRQPRSVSKLSLAAAFVRRPRDT